MENRKGTSKSRRWLLLAVINLCLILMCGIAFGTYAYAARADTGDTEDAELKDAASEEKWYTLSDDGELLSVFLHKNMIGYDWRYGSSNEKLRQVRVHKDDEDPEVQYTDMWRLYLRPRDEEEGEVQLTFVCVRDTESDSIDTRTLKIRIKNGKMMIEEE